MLNKKYKIIIFGVLIVAVTTTIIYLLVKKKKQPCKPDCKGKKCGDDDGCGDTCKTGTCDKPNYTCVDGVCKCQSNCENKFCGDPDGCGNTCDGKCSYKNANCVKDNTGYKCECKSDCNGNKCGKDDGCGNICDGTCNQKNYNCVNKICQCSGNNCGDPKYTVQFTDYLEDKVNPDNSLILQQHPIYLLDTDNTQIKINGYNVKCPGNGTFTDSLQYKCYEGTAKYNCESNVCQYVNDSGIGAPWQICYPHCNPSLDFKYKDILYAVSPNKEPNYKKCKELIFFDQDRCKAICGTDCPAIGNLITKSKEGSYISQGDKLTMSDCTSNNGVYIYQDSGDCDEQCGDWSGQHCYKDPYESVVI
jgi:hypothetical protein